MFPVYKIMSSVNKENLKFNFLETASQTCGTILHSLQQYMRVPVPPHPASQLVPFTQYAIIYLWENGQKN